ncbi:39S ribosomal protein L22, mitochondrial [Pleosporales sp. CAS-2024a]
MSGRIASRRLGQSAFAVLGPPRQRRAPSASFSVSARHRLSSPFGRRRTEGQEDLTNPLLEQYLQRKEAEEGGASDQKKKKKKKPPPPPPALREGGMGTESLFRPEYELPGWTPSMPAGKKAELKAQAAARRAAIKAEQEKRLSELNIDPDPRARRRLERRLVIQSVKRHGRLTKAQNIARTERQSLYKSQVLPTSTKKLQKVVNQIAGKTVSEALVQLRFSKKKIARDVIKGLEIARDEAIVARGMGLGGRSSARVQREKQRTLSELPHSHDKSTVTATQKQTMHQGPVTIELKDGSKKLIRDPSEVYIDQAWVGKGEMWKSPEYRARGAVNMLRHRTTSFTVLLKEEKTRMRISEEIKKKRDKRKLWTALPDRPVTAQRQYCLW